MRVHDRIIISGGRGDPIISSQTQAKTSSGRKFARAKKSLGQHFLTDKRILRRMLDASDLSAQDTVLEIGPGRGFLTRELAAYAGRVVGLELDRSLVATLTDEFQNWSHVNIVYGEAREVDINTLIPEQTSYKVIANLPYYAASPIIRRFLNIPHRPSMMVVMLQYEVAREMVAKPGEMGFLSVLIQLRAKPMIICKVPPRAFKPRPKVDSALLRVDVLPKLALELDSEEEFIELVRAGFSAPRKQVHNCLQKSLGLLPEEVGRILAAADVDPVRRPQTLAVEEWGAVYTAFKTTRSIA